MYGLANSDLMLTLVNAFSIFISNRDAMYLSDIKSYITSGCHMYLSRCHMYLFGPRFNHWGVKFNHWGANINHQGTNIH